LEERPCPEQEGGEFGLVDFDAEAGGGGDFGLVAFDDEGFGQLRWR
jgi:hypothetical protein